MLDVTLPRPRNRIELASDRTYLKCREAVLKFLYERHRFVEAAGVGSAMTEKLVIIGNGMAPGRMLEKPVREGSRRL